MRFPVPKVQEMYFDRLLGGFVGRIEFWADGRPRAMNCLYQAPAATPPETAEAALLAKAYLRLSPRPYRQGETPFWPDVIAPPARP